MRTSERLLILMLIGMLGACHENAPAIGRAGSPAVARTSAAAIAGVPAQTPYGVIADISSAGDPAQYGASAQVYVFLREPGKRMPVAMQYFHARELPKRVSLVAHAPLSGTTLVARLSPSGRIERSQDDIETTATVENVGHPPEAVQLELRRGAHSPDANRQFEPPAQFPTATARPFRVRAIVDIDSSEDLAPDTPVFVVARAGRASMPLAVRKLTVAELPAQIELSDDDSMLMSRRLSSARTFTLQARVSPNGRSVHSDQDAASDTVTIDRQALPDSVALAIRSSPARSPGR